MSELKSRNQLDHYLQAFRLHQGLTRASNEQSRVHLRNAVSADNNLGRDLPRSYGLMSFTIQTAWLCNWIELSDANAMRADAAANFEALGAPAEDAHAGLTAESGDSVNSIVMPVILAYAKVAAALDGDDYDNRWSLGTASLYSRQFPEAFSEYDAAVLGAGSGAPQACRSSLDVDYADCLFFAGSKNLSDAPDDYRKAIVKAIDLTKKAILDNPHDSKRHRWSWTLGWAYYELAAYEDASANYKLSLATLRNLRSPHLLILKNLIASAVGAGETDFAEKMAAELRKIDGKYNVSQEDRWPYRDCARRERFKDHLRAAGLAG